MAGERHDVAFRWSWAFGDSFCGQATYPRARARVTGGQQPRGMAIPLTWDTALLSGSCYWLKAENLPCTLVSGVPGSASTLKPDEPHIISHF